MKKETGEITVGDKTFEATMVTLEPDLQKKDVTITENKTTTIEADSEYDGLEEVNVTTNVQGGIDPSGANAQPSDVAYGKTFYAGNEVEKTGTLEEYAGATTITTNGELATENKILRDNLTINIPRGYPIDVATENEMTALLVAANVGKAYRYTGVTGTYTNGDIYVVEEV